MASSLKGNFSWMLLGTIITSASQWGILVLLAKLGSEVDVGVFSLGLAVTAPFFMFSNLNLEGVYITDRKMEYPFATYFSLRTITSLLACSVCVLVIFLSGYPKETYWALLFMTIGKWLEAQSDMLHAYLHHQEKLKQMSLAIIIRNCLAFVLVLVTFLICNNIVWAIFSWTAARLIILLIVDYPNYLKTKKNVSLWNFDLDLFSLFKKALPLGIVMGLISVNTNIPRYFLVEYENEASVGIFSAIAYITVAASLVINALGQSASPKLAQYYSDNNYSEFQSLLSKMLLFGLVIAFVANTIVWFFGADILRIVYGDVYSQSAAPFFWLMMGAGVGFIGNFLGFGVTAARIFHLQIPVYIVVVIASLLSCYLFVPSKGIEGASIAFFLSSCVFCLCYFLILFFDLSKKKRII